MTPLRRASLTCIGLGLLLMTDELGILGLVVAIAVLGYAWLEELE